MTERVLPSTEVARLIEERARAWKDPAPFSVIPRCDGLTGAAEAYYQHVIDRADELVGAAQALQDATEHHAKSEREWYEHCNVLNAQLAALAAQRDELEKEVALDDALLAERNRLLALFDCPVHGSGCVPNAIEQVEKMRKRSAALEAERDDFRRWYVADHLELEQARDELARARAGLPRSP